MSKKKTAAKALGASTLAAATVVSGLGFGALPATAAPAAPDAAPKAVENRISFPAAWELQNGKVAASPDTSQHATFLWEYDSPPSKLKNYEFIPVSGTDWGILMDNFVDGQPSATSICSRVVRGAIVGGNGSLATCLADAEGSAEYRWKFVGGFLTTADGSQAVSQVQSVNGRATTTTSDKRLWARNLGLNARVDNVDVEAGTAQLADGIAPNEASSVEVSYKDKDGRTVTRDETVTNGAWSASLRNLSLGKTTVHLKAFDGADPLLEADVEVDLPVTPLVATGSFSADIDEVATVSGTATPNTEIKLSHGERTIASTTSDDEGNYSIPVNAPNMPGTYDLTVTQTIRGEDATPKEVTLDYGTGVSITSPAPDFELGAGEQLTITGAAQTGSKVRVYEKGHANEVLAEATGGSNNTYRATVRGLEDREYQLVVEGLSKGYNRTRAEVTVNPGKSVIAPIEASVEFRDALTDDAHVVGTAEKGAEITIRNGDDTIATGRANGDGNFDIAIPSQGPGEHTLTLTETTGDATKSADIPVDFGAAVAATVEGGATIAGSTAKITGTGSAGAKIVITEGGKKVAETTVTDSGSFSVPVEEIQNGQHDYVVTQTARGNTTSTADVSVTRDAPVTPVGLTSPQSGDSYPAKSTVRFTGTGTPGATVLLDAFGGLADYSTTVDWDGSWTIDRPMNIGTYRFDVIQTAKGQESRIDGIELVEEGTPVDRPFAVTAPESGSTHKDEVVEFTGTGTPGSTITLDPKVAGLSTVTTTVRTNGTWSVNRYLGTGAYSFDVYQTTDGTETGRTTVEVNQPASVDRPFAVTSPEDGSEHRNEMVTFAGTGTPRAEIVVHVSNFPSTDVTTTVGADGRWSVKKWLGSGAYVLDVTQKTNGLPSGSTTLHLNSPAAPIDKPFAITSHTDGGTFTPGQAETFRGTGAAGATITIDPGAGLAKVTTIVERTGDWSVAKWLGNGPYTFTVSQTDGDDTTTLAPFTITPAN